MSNGNKLCQIERQLILYDIFQCNDEDTRISTIQYHLPGMTIRTLQRDIKDLTDADLIHVYFSRYRNAYICYDSVRELRFYPESVQKRIIQKRNQGQKKTEISIRRQEHLKKLKRLVSLMRCGEITEKAVDKYFEMFPNATERMRKRDFEILRHIGYYAGLDRESGEYVLYQREDCGFYEGYGVYVEDGKMRHSC